MKNTRNILMSILLTTSSSGLVSCVSPSSTPASQSYRQKIKHPISSELYFAERSLLSPHRESPGRVNLKSEFLAGAIDESKVIGDSDDSILENFYPMYDLKSGDRVGFFCFTHNNEGNLASLILLAPNYDYILRENFVIKSDNQNFGATYEVSKLISVFGEGEYQGMWLFDDVLVKTSLVNLRR